MKKIFLLSILSIVLLFGCTDSYQPPKQNVTSVVIPVVQNTTPPVNHTTTIANPAAVYCANANYTYVTKNMSSGQAGYCSRGTLECDEWKLFRGECCLQEVDCTAKNCTDGPAYCSSQTCWCPVIPKNITVKNDSSSFPPQTNQTIDQLLDAGLNSINSNVYTSMNSSTFYNKKSFKWALAVLGSNQPPEEIPLGTIMPAHIYINNKTDATLRGFAFSVYSPETSGYNTITMGLAIFLNDSSTMEGSYSQGTRFKVTYTPPQANKILEKCEVQNRQVWKMSSGKIVYSYFFDCGVAWDG